MLMLREVAKKLVHLKEEHTPLVRKIALDPGMLPETRASLLEHVLEEEQEQVDKLSQLVLSQASFSEQALFSGQASSAATSPTSSAFAPRKSQESTGIQIRMNERSPVSDRQLEQLMREIGREAQRTRVARRFLGMWGPLGAGIETVKVEQYGPDRDAEIEHSGQPDPDPISAANEHFLRVPTLYKDFVLHWRDVALAEKLGAPLDASRAIRAAHSVVDREDQLLFNGEPRLGLEGLLNASGRSIVKRNEWSTYGTAYADVVRATEILLQHNHHRPFALAVSAQDYALLARQREAQYAPEVEALRGLCDEGVFTSPTIPQGRAVVLSTGDQNFDIAVAEDLSLAFLGEDGQNYPFRVYECVVLRIKRPKAICTIE